MTKSNNQATFRELYNLEVEKDAKRPSAAQQFIAKIAQITMKSETTVKMWLYTEQKPDELTKAVIAQALKTSPDALFPKQQVL